MDMSASDVAGTVASFVGFGNSGEAEVSLSDSSFSDDSSGDDGYEDSGMNTDNCDGGREDDDFLISGDCSVDSFASGLQTQKKSLYRQSVDFESPTYHLRHSSHDGSQTRPDLKKTFGQKSYLDEIPSSMDGRLPLPLTLSLARQHVHLARSCLELLNERDRLDALRRRNIRRFLLNGYKKLNEAYDKEETIEEDGNSCPLLTMIKSGPLYKLHVKGGKASRRISSKLSKGRSGNKNGMDVSGRKREGMVAQRFLTSWKPKFVEVRKGIFLYYSDSPKSYSFSSSSKEEEGLVRKSIPLQATICICRAVNYFGSSIADKKKHAVREDGGIASAAHLHVAPVRLFAFELIVQGLPACLFAAGTEAGRQAWIRAIGKGMVGDGSGADLCASSGGNGIDIRKNFQIEKFVTLSCAAANAATNTSYIVNFAKPLWGSTIRFPSSSIRTSILPLLSEGDNILGLVKNKREAEAEIHAVSQSETEKFWSGLKHFNFVINNQTLRGQSIHGPERAFGALTRHILDCDKSYLLPCVGDGLRDGVHQGLMTEIQAARYARDILKMLSAEFRGKVVSLEMAVNALCSNRNLVSIMAVSGICDSTGHHSSRKEAPTISIDVSSRILTKKYCSTKEQCRNYDRREWLHVLTKKSKVPRQCFTVLSVGVLCLYKEELPRPHKLIGHFFLVGAKVGFWEEAGKEPGHSTQIVSSTDKLMKTEEPMVSQTKKLSKYTISLVSKDGNQGELHLCFMDYVQFSGWRDALVLAVELCSYRPVGDVASSMNKLLNDQQQRPASAEISTSTQLLPYDFSSRLPHTLSESSKHGVTWVTPSATLMLEQDEFLKSHMRNREMPLLPLSSFWITRRKLDCRIMMPTSFSFRVASSRPTSSGIENSTRSTISSIPGAVSAASRLLSKKLSRITTSGNERASNDLMMEYDTMLNPVEPTVELEVKFSTFYHLYFHDAHEPALATLRATCIERICLSGGEKGRLMKGQNITKLDALKGAVRRDTFEFMCDDERRPERRATI